MGLVWTGRLESDDGFRFSKRGHGRILYGFLFPHQGKDVKTRVERVMR